MTLLSGVVKDGSIVCLLHVDTSVQDFVCSAREVPGQQNWNLLSNELPLPTRSFAGYVLHSCLSHAGELDGAKQQAGDYEATPGDSINGAQAS